MLQASSVEVPFSAYFNVLECLLTKRLGQGRFIKLFEREVCKLFGVKHCIATSNGTQADLTMLIALSELYPNRKEVIMPALTFPAQSNAVLMSGLTPVFVEVTDEFVIDWNLAHPNENTLCYFPTHLLGFSANIPKYVVDSDIPTIEDCCEAMLGYDKNGLFGTRGIGGSFSMFPSHLITTGEGGFIVTNHDLLASLCRKIINHGKNGSDFDFSTFGTNSKWTNLSAAIGCSVIGHADGFRKKRIEHFKYFNKCLGLSLPISTSPHAYPYICQSEEERNIKLSWLQKTAPDIRKMFPCIPDLSAYMKRFGFSDNNLYTNARNFRNRGILIPCPHNLNKEDIEAVCMILKAK